MFIFGKYYLKLPNLQKATRIKKKPGKCIYIPHYIAIGNPELQITQVNTQERRYNTYKTIIKTNKHNQQNKNNKDNETNLHIHLI